MPGGPEWSHRLARLVNAEAFAALPMVVQLDFRAATRGTQRVTDLPAWARKIVKQIEGSS